MLRKLAILISVLTLSCSTPGYSDGTPGLLIPTDFFKNELPPPYYLVVLEECASKRVTSSMHVHAVAHPENEVDNLEEYLNYVFIDNPYLMMLLKSTQTLSSLNPAQVLPTDVNIVTCMEALIQVHRNYCTFNPKISDAVAAWPFPRLFATVPFGLSCDPKDLIIPHIGHCAHQVLAQLLDESEFFGYDRINLEYGGRDCLW